MDCGYRRTTARVSLLDQSDESVCFEIMTGDVYVAEVTGGEGEWAFVGIVHNTGPDQWGRCEVRSAANAYPRSGMGNPEAAAARQPEAADRKG